MEQAKDTVNAGRGGKKVVSRGDALALMITAAVAAVATSAATVTGIMDYFRGPVTLTLPLATRHQGPSGLNLGAEAHYTAVEATMPVLPAAEATLLAWAGVLNQVSILAVLSLGFLLAFQLRSKNLFTAGSSAIIGTCGVVLAMAGTVGQILDQAAGSRLAEVIGANQRSAEEGIIFMGNLNLTPLVAGSVLILIATAFEYGRRLKKDTEGLV